MSDDAAVALVCALDGYGDYQAQLFNLGPHRGGGRAFRPVQRKRQSHDDHGGAGLGYEAGDVYVVLGVRTASRQDGQRARHAAVVVGQGDPNPFGAEVEPEGTPRRLRPAVGQGAGTGVILAA